MTSPDELGTMALALLAQPDPVAGFLHRTAGRLGPDHDLDTGTRRAWTCALPFDGASQKSDGGVFPLVRGTIT